MNIAVDASGTAEIEDMTELVVIPQTTALKVFTTEGAMEPYLLRVRKEIDAFESDISTEEGRDRLKRFAKSVIKVKTHLEEIGKGLADEQKKIPKLIDATRRDFKEKLDAWAAEVREPLTKWEAAESDRVEQHKATIRMMAEAFVRASGKDAATLRAELAKIEAVAIDVSCEEFEAEYAIAKDQALVAVREALAARVKADDEAAELAKLRADAATRAAKDRDDEIRREAASKAAAEVEAKAQREVETARAREAALKAEVELANQRAADAARRAQEEIDRKAAAEAAETKRREADREHKATVNRRALAALVDAGVSEEIGKLVIKLIATGAVPAISIHY